MFNAFSKYVLHTGLFQSEPDSWDANAIRLTIFLTNAKEKNAILRTTATPNAIKYFLIIKYALNNI
jgi:hypothetical protein